MSSIPKIIYGWRRSDLVIWKKFLIKKEKENNPEIECLYDLNKPIERPLGVNNGGPK